MKIEESLSTSSDDIKFTNKKRPREKNVQKKIFRNPTSITYLKDVATDSFCNALDNTFCVFTSIIRNISYLIYANKSHSIISYNLSIEQKLFEVKNAHEKHITFIKHYFYKINYR